MTVADVSRKIEQYAQESRAYERYRTRDATLIPAEQYEARLDEALKALREQTERQAKELEHVCRCIVSLFFYRNRYENRLNSYQCIISNSCDRRGLFIYQGPACPLKHGLRRPDELLRPTECYMSRSPIYQLLAL